MKRLLLVLTLCLMLVPPVYAFLSGDGQTRGATFSGMIVLNDETITCAADAGTASTSYNIHYIVTDGGGDTNDDTIALADGVAGQIMIFVYKTETDTGDSANITPTNLAGGTKITFDVPGEGCVMVFDGTNWSIVANNGGTIA